MTEHSPASGRTPVTLAGALARRRVTLGFVAAAVTLLFAQPTWETWAAGLAVAIVGEGIRVWAAGHLEKGREVTRSGPYRWVSHPLYLGSSVMTIGVVMASRSLIVAVVGAAYLASTLTAAIRTEEAFLRDRFGETYERYRLQGREPTARRFSAARALRNREHRAIAGLIGGFALLALKIGGLL